MARSTTKSYIVTLRMYPTQKDMIVLNHRFNAVHHITNVVVKHAIGCLDQLKRDKRYNDIVKNLKDRKLTTNEKQILNNIRCEYGLSEYQFHSYITKQQYMYTEHIDSFTAQKIATKVWQSVSTCLFSKGETVHFKKMHQVKSFEGKSNDTGIRYRDGYVTHKGLKIKTCYRKNDKYIKDALNNSRIKYCRIKRKWHKHGFRYYVDLIMEGTPPKVRNFDNYSTVGIDIGPSTIAVVSDKECLLQELSEGVVSVEKEIAKLQRRADRQQRANNPDNYNKDGTIKEGRKTWIVSRHHKITKDKIKMLYQKRANQIEQSHILLANKILSLGTNIIVEDMNWAVLSKRVKETKIDEKTNRYKKKRRFGKSILNHAPSKLISIINTKLSYLDKEIIKVDCFKTAATKYNHVTGELMDNVTLKDRYVYIDNYKIQRDLHSAFNLKHIIIHKGKNKKDTTYNYDVIAMYKEFDQFMHNHDKLIEKLIKQKHLGKKFPRCMSI